MVTFALLERVKAAHAPSGEALADDVVLSSVSGKLSGARIARVARGGTNAASLNAAEQLLGALDIARRAAGVIFSFTRASITRTDACS